MREADLGGQQHQRDNDHSAMLQSEDAVIERTSLCLSSPDPGIAAHHGERGFAAGIVKYFNTAESNAAERLIQLKAEIKDADTETFWRRLMEGMTDICHAQYGFVAKRILVDDHDAAVEMPPLGEPGSCLLGVAFYYNDGKDLVGLHRDYKYLAWGAPCAHMRHDKVFLIPEKLSSFITNNPNAFPFPTEAYLGLPLFSEGKCFAHFGMMWTEEGLAKKDVSWGYLEMILHTLEDLILERLLSGQGFSKQPTTQPGTKVSKVIPQDAITASQSLKPYARSLSHELRTPMQGVVGMLDVMHATVQEAIEAQPNAKIRNVFQALKENIEVVQDSSRRAVEAADNVVHAYDLNMEVPDTPQNESDSPITNLSSTGVFENRPNILIAGSNIPVNAFKRRRSSPISWQYGSATKQRDVKKSPSRRETLSPRSENVKPVGPESDPTLRFSPDGEVSLSSRRNSEAPGSNTLGMSSMRYSVDLDTFPIPGLRHSKLRELLPIVIHESLHVGGRPDSAIAEPIDQGERIEVRSRSSSGHSSMKTIEWSVHPDVPETLLVDERDLAKLVSCIFLNAVKFTDCGNITLTANLSKNSRYVLIRVVDTGTGIPEDFRPELFKPFSRENDSLTRSKEGLGLGLMVAKGVARRIGGDLTLIRSDVEGANRGSEFEIKVPIESTDGSSMPGTPSNRTPTPSRGPTHQSSTTSLRKDPSYTSSRQSPKVRSPLQTASPSRQNTNPNQLVPPTIASIIEEPMVNTPRRVSSTPRLTSDRMAYDRQLAQKYPLTFLVAEDNKINRKLLVSMLSKFGYEDVYEAFDGAEAVRVMAEICHGPQPTPPPTAATQLTRSRTQARLIKPVDVILMDLWMPELDGYDATTRILELFADPTPAMVARGLSRPPTILAVSADVTDEAIDRATRAGMEGFMTKPYKLMDLQRLIEEFCGRKVQAQLQGQTEIQTQGGPSS